MPTLKCKICEIRKPRRYCPGVSGDICSICCGSEREMTVRCPLDCGYLEEARLHEKLDQLPPEKIPNADVRVTESFLEANESLFVLLLTIVLKAALAEEAIDSDVQEALDAGVRTYRTLDSGLYYETRPDNPIAARIQGRIREGIDEIREAIRRDGENIPDTTIQRLLVTCQRLAASWDNHRRYGRSFIDYLRRSTPPLEPPAADEPLLIQPA